MMLGFLVFMYLQGNGSEKSVIGVAKCKAGYWALLIALITLGVFMTVIAIYVQKHDYELKKSIDWKFTPCDLQFSTREVTSFPLYALVISFTAILIGFTPAFLYVPLLAMSKLVPDNVIQTNAVICLFATMCATLLNLIFKRMPLNYFWLVIVLTIGGTAVGIFMQGMVMRKTGKFYYSMTGFNLVILTLLATITSYQSYVLVLKQQAGVPISRLPSFC